MGEITVVFDTNIFVSALGWNQNPEQCLLYGLRGDIEMIVSPDTLTELWRVLAYDHLPFTDAERIAFYHLVFHASTVVTPDVDLSVSDDSDDDKFLEAAITGDADVIVSGDDHLLRLECYEDIEIVDPTTFLEEWSPDGNGAADHGA
jgi:putative PIN family toxin of toxin-antitoxin system